MNLARLLCTTGMVLLLTSCDVDLYHSLPENEANQMLAILMLHHIDANKKQEEGGITISVRQSQFINAVGLLRLNGFPLRKFTTVDELFPANQLVVSPLEEQQKINFLKEQRIEDMLSQLDGVISANVTIALPSEEDKGSSTSPTSVAVLIKYSPQTNMRSFQLKIKELVEKSIPGLQYNQISILMQPAEYRVISALSGTQTYQEQNSLNMDDDKGRVMKWLKSFYPLLLFALVGLLLSLTALLRYYRQRRRH